MTKKERMYQRIEKHGADLNAIFKTEFDNITLCKKLLKIESKAHHATACLCNTNTLDLLELNQYTGYDVKQATEAEQDLFFDKIRESLAKILGKKASNIVHINFDPRGYALKIKGEYLKENNLKIYQDWGGYGIIAPEFDGEQ
jgi:hypothetical protein